MTNVVLVSCSKSKLDGVHCAEDLYKPSNIFPKRRRFALERGDRWGILSAKYGYLRPWEAIPNYERHIDARTPIWAAFVLEDLLVDLAYYDADCVTVLAGSGYVDPLVAPLEARGYEMVDWNEGLRPGERMSALDDELAPGDQQTLTGEVTGGE